MTNQKGILIGAFNNNNLTAITASGSASVGVAAAAASTTVVSSTRVQAKVNSGAQLNQRNKESVTSASKVKDVYKRQEQQLPEQTAAWLWQ